MIFNITTVPPDMVTCHLCGLPTHVSSSTLDYLHWVCPSLRYNIGMSHLKGIYDFAESSWNVMAHGDAWEVKWRRNWRMEWIARTLHITSESGVSSITTANAHTSVASCRLNWRPRWFKWTHPFRRKMKSGFCACAITFQTQSTSPPSAAVLSDLSQLCSRQFAITFQLASTMNQQMHNELTKLNELLYKIHLECAK